MDDAPFKPSLGALLWDVDGTLAETELDGHRPAFNLAFAEEGLPWHWDPATYIQLLAISGGRERLRVYLSDQGPEPPDPALLDALVRRKQQHYTALMASGAIRLRPGVERLITAAASAGLRQAVVTTSGRVSAQALIDRLLPGAAAIFAFLVCGDDVAALKPSPDAYTLALSQLAMPAAAVVAIEDSSNGTRAATAAGLRTLVTLSEATRQEPLAVFEGAAAIVSQLGEGGAPVSVLQGPPCPDGLITLSYLEQLAVPS
jgi:HAD superfamily hydrolase (TIGR01509 family)